MAYATRREHWRGALLQLHCAWPLVHLCCDIASKSKGLAMFHGRHFHPTLTAKSCLLVLTRIRRGDIGGASALGSRTNTVGPFDDRPGWGEAVWRCWGKGGGIGGWGTSG